MTVEEAQADAEFSSPITTYGDFLCELQQALWNKWTAAELSQNYGEQLKRIYKQFIKQQKVVFPPIPKAARNAFGGGA